MNSEIYLFIIIGVTFLLAVICLILAIMNSSKLSALMDYSDEGDLMSSIEAYYSKVETLAGTINKSSDAVMNERLTACENDILKPARKIGVVNFDAYDDVTGGMSFALTILNGHDTGIILTSLYGHNSCNTYIREINEGEPNVKLLSEERESLLKAMNSDSKEDTNG